MEEKIIEVIEQELKESLNSSDIRIIVINKKGTCHLYLDLPHIEELDRSTRKSLEERIINLEDTLNDLGYKEYSNYYGTLLSNVNAQKLYELLKTKKESSLEYEEE